MAPPSSHLSPEGPAASPRGCRQCGAPLSGPTALAERGFCCAGCEAAAGLLDPSELVRLLDPSRSLPPDGAGPDTRRYEAFDEPEVAERYVATGAGGRKVVRLELANLRCASCLWVLEQLPGLVPGIMAVRVRWSPPSMVVTFDRGVGLGAVIAAVARLGYDAHPVPVGRPPRATGLSRDDRIRLAVAGACAGNAMMFAAALYLGDHYGMDALARNALRHASAAVGAVGVFGPGRVFLSGARAALAARIPHMDLPIALALIVGSATGLWNVATGRGEIYFDTLAALVFLLLVGRALQAWQQSKALAETRLLRQLVPTWVIRLGPDGRPHTVPLAALRPGDTALVPPGATIPADGVVAAGRGEVDEAVLTGESRPVPVRPGSSVWAGTKNLGAALQVQVRAAGEATRIGRIAEQIEDASSKKGRIVRQADRIGAWFVAGVTGLAALTLVLWWPVSPARAIEHAVALLVVACPCALGLATPLAVAASAAAAARHGLFLRDPDALSLLGRGGTIFFDKTGTLTDARLDLLRFHGPKELLGRVAALERGLKHPVARALARAAPPAGRVAARTVAAHRSGVCGRLDGHRLAVGSRAFLEEAGVLLCEPLRTQWEVEERAGHTTVGVACEGRLSALAVLAPRLRPEAPRVLSRLAAQGPAVAILSGDAQGVVEAVGRRLGLPPDACFGGLSPEAKIERVRRARGPVVMVGDGVNDAGALAAADVGIVVSGGAETAIRAAAVCTVRPGLEGVLHAHALAAATRRVVRRNIAVAVLYNAVAVAMAMAGTIGPLWAAVLMPASSLSVVGSTAWWFARWRP